jgi:signal peptidase I
MQREALTETQNHKPGKKQETLSESISGFTAVFVTGLFIITFIFKNFEIPSGSMENTLLIGDHILVDRISPLSATGYTGPLVPYRHVRHDDIIVFVSPVDPGRYLVKRIIGLPGDRLHMRDGVVYRNGEKLDEPYTIPGRGLASVYADNFPTGPRGFRDPVSPEWPVVMSMHMKDGDLVVPEGHYFGMGDNREISLDSRYWGFIPERNILGRPLFIYWSFVTPRKVYDRTSWRDRASFMLHILLHFGGDTRWSRMFHRVR